MATVHVVIPKTRTVQYDGTNALEVDKLIPRLVLKRVKPDGSIDIESGSVETNVKISEWIVYRQEQVMTVLPDNEIRNFYDFVDGGVIANV